MQHGAELGPLPARMGLACHKCWKETDVQLSRCGGCRRISYCGTECRNADWKAHKPMCKDLSSLENNLKSSLAAARLEAARELHQGASEDLRDGLSQCEMNKLTRGQIMFESMMTSWLDRQNQLVWIPKRVKSGWVSLEGRSWQGEFDGELRKSFGMPTTFPLTFLITAASDTLAMAMSILYGLGKLHNDDDWTKKDTLTVHILGADDREVNCCRVFQEILHRTPEVKMLKLVMCGPEVPVLKLRDQGVCSHCVALGGSYVLECVAGAYHDFVERQGNEFEDPDFCIAFNSGASAQLP
ncbi:hypothetical protein B0H16DRAFT_1813545 [Mycena metata]|uniref:MYND-type domain-containing protein n=1 Tax=Mycena metata TaxID=1033252 RepID=A0AAD7H4T7_9AGAR|nr:hypothetical protein B0H16DRAFT_1813545 [Mycena metata]